MAGGSVPRFKGLEFDFGGQRLVIPPLTLGALESMQERLQRLEGVSSIEPEAIRTVVDAATLALVRNYPKMTRAEVADLIDLANMQEVMAAVMDVSGMLRKQREAAGGNDGAAAAASPSPSLG